MKCFAGAGRRRVCVWWEKGQEAGDEGSALGAARVARGVRAVVCTLAVARSRARAC